MNQTNIQIKELFHAQYTLLIEMESMLINASMKSKTEMRYDFAIQKIDENSFECRLVQLDLFIREANNNLIKEVAELTGAFNRMFNELHLKMSHSGIVLEVINIDLILSKWAQTKQLMQQAANKNDDLKDLISLSDSMFSDPDKMLQAIQANEFIQTYFGNFFGTQIPFSKQEHNRTNYFNTAYLPFKIDVETDNGPNENNEIKINTLAVPAVILDRDFKKNAYKSFEDKIDLDTIIPNIKEQATHLIEITSGKLITAEILKQEKVEEKLFTKMSYKMNVEGSRSSTNHESVIEGDQDAEKTRFKFF